MESLTPMGEVKTTFPLVREKFMSQNPLTHFLTLSLVLFKRYTPQHKVEKYPKYKVHCVRLHSGPKKGKNHKCVKEEADHDGGALVGQVMKAWLSKKKKNFITLRGSEPIY